MSLYDDVIKHQVFNFLILINFFFDISNIFSYKLRPINTVQASVGNFKVSTNKICKKWLKKKRKKKKNETQIA